MNDQIGNGGAGLSRIGANVVEKLENNLVFTKECVFSLSKRFTIPSSAVGGGVVDIVFDGTLLDSPGKFLIFLPIFFQAFGAGPVTIDLYFGVDASEDGTEWDCFNRNNDSAKECVSKIWLSPTIVDPGTKLPPEFEIPSDGTPATSVLGGSAGDTIITNARKDGKYMFRLTNTEANTARGVVALNWFEL